MQVFESNIDTPIGPLAVITSSDEALIAACFEERRAVVANHLQRHLGTMTLAAGIPDHVRAGFHSYFDGSLDAFKDLQLRYIGSDFQIRVWQSVRKIEAGHTATYGELARDLGDAKATRAVGGANGANPLLLVIPCHRVVGAAGQLRGYAGGATRKSWLLRHEGVIWEQPSLAPMVQSEIPSVHEE